MSKKAKIKEIKNINNNSNKISNSELGNLIKLVLVVTGIFIVFYFVTTIITGENKKQTPPDNEIVIQYDEILLSNLLKQSNTEYYVLISKKDDEYVKSYNTYISSYITKADSIRFYTASLDNGFNKSYIGEKTSINATDMTKTKFAGTTLVKIKNAKIVATFDTEEKITAEFQKIIK